MDPEKIYQAVLFLQEHPGMVVVVLLCLFGPTIALTVLATRRILNYYTKDEIDTMLERMGGAVDANGLKAVQEVKEAHGKTAQFLQKTSEEMGQITSNVNTLGKLVGELAGQSKVMMEIVMDSVRQGKTFRPAKATRRKGRH